MERTASCPSCRRGIFAEDAFCSWCGTRVQTRATGTGEGRRALASRTIPTMDRLACGSCNGPILPGDVFCPACGARHMSEDAAALGETWGVIPKRVCESSGGKYEFVRDLGRGGMGIVFVARDRELGRLVAIKVLSPAWLSDETMVERFRREARTIASLRHESIVTVYDEGRAGDLSYFVMDFIEGVSLSRILKLHGSLPVPMVEAILYRVGSALSYAHRPGRGIVHRDIKPSNIMLDSDGLAVVMDFGISKVSEQSSGLTMTGLVMGTPEYMSPEQCRGHTVTAESDQYSLGAVVYAMLTGAPPFTGPFYQVLMAHQTDPLPSLLEARPDCPPRLASAVERMLAKSPGDRWSSIREALRELGLRPLTPDDPVLEDLGALVRATLDRGGREDGRGVQEEDEDTRRTPSSIRILPHPDELEVGDEVSLTATVLFPDGVEETGSGISWETTDPAIARVDPETGKLVAVGAGSALITAAGLGLEESLAVEVRPPRVVEIAMSPAQVELRVGETMRLEAELRDKRGRAMEGAVLWSSSDPRTATVSAEGVVTARREGAVSVLAHSGGVGAATSVRVIPGATESVEVSHVRVTSPPEGVRVSETFSLEATPVAEDGRGLRRPVQWSVEDPDIVESLGDGRFRAVGRGQGAVVAQSDGVRTRVWVRVEERKVAHSEPETPPSRPIPGVSPEETPAPEPRPPLADEPDGTGLPGRRILAGAAAVVVAVLGLWALSGLFMSDGPLPVASLEVLADGGGVGPEGLVMVSGESASVSVRATAEDGTELDRPVTWSSSNPAVASVGPSGVLEALAVGEALLTASSEGVSRDLPVRVESAVAELTVRTAGDGEPVTDGLDLEVGDAVELEGVALDAAGAPLAREPVAWTSSALGVASVDENGRVSARGPGDAVLTASAGGVAFEVPVTVTRPASTTGTNVSPPSPGTLSIRVDPWANVLIDGTPRGTATADRELTLSLSPGTYEVQILIQGVIQCDTTVVITSGETTPITMEGGDPCGPSRSY